MSLHLDKSRWKRVWLGDVVRNVNDSVRDPKGEGIDRVIAMEHMDPGKLTIERWGNLEDGTSFARRVKPGQTLFGKRRAYQRKVAFADFDAICSGDILTFASNESEMLAEFLPFLVQSEAFFDHALGTSAGSLSPRTNWRDLAKFEFDLPPLDDQKRIAALIWSIQRCLTASHEQSEVLGRVVQTLFAHASEGVTKSTLAQWVSHIEAGRSPRASAEPAGEGEYGVLKVSAVGNGSFVPEENKRLLDPAEFRANDAVRAGDLLVTRANAVVDNVARPSVVDQDYPNLMLSDKTLRLVPAAAVPARAILGAVQSRAYRQYVREAVNGTEAKNISQKKILAGPVPDLSPEALRGLVAKLEETDRAVQAVKREELQLSNLRRAIMADVFGGN